MDTGAALPFLAVPDLSSPIHNYSKVFSISKYLGFNIQHLLPAEVSERLVPARLVGHAQDFVCPTGHMIELPTGEGHQCLHKGLAKG